MKDRKLLSDHEYIDLLKETQFSCVGTSEKKIHDIAVAADVVCDNAAPLLHFGLELQFLVKEFVEVLEEL